MGHMCETCFSPIKRYRSLAQNYVRQVVRDSIALSKQVRSLVGMITKAGDNARSKPRPDLRGGESGHRDTHIYIYIYIGVPVYISIVIFW